MAKSADAFRTISEVAEWLDTPAHVLRFWESKFTQIKPVKRAGGRRYYRPADMALIGGIKKLLHDDGMTIKGAQKVLREQGVKYVSDLSPSLEDDRDAPVDAAASPPPEAPSSFDVTPPPKAPVVPFPSATPQPSDAPAPTPAHEVAERPDDMPAAETMPPGAPDGSDLSASEADVSASFEASDPETSDPTRDAPEPDLPAFLTRAPMSDAPAETDAADPPGIAPSDPVDTAGSPDGSDAPFPAPDADAPDTDPAQVTAEITAPDDEDVTEAPDLSGDSDAPDRSGEESAAPTAEDASDLPAFLRRPLSSDTDARDVTGNDGTTPAGMDDASEGAPDDTSDASALPPEQKTPVFGHRAPDEITTVSDPVAETAPEAPDQEIEASAPSEEEPETATKALDEPENASDEAEDVSDGGDVDDDDAAETPGISEPEPVALTPLGQDIPSDPEMDDATGAASVLTAAFAAGRVGPGARDLLDRLRAVANRAGRGDGD